MEEEQCWLRPYLPRLVEKEYRQLGKSTIQAASSFEVMNI